VRVAYQGHELPHGSLNRKALAALNSNHGALTRQRGEHDVSSVGLENLSNLVEAGEQDAVNLGSRNRDILDVEPDSRDGLVQLLLGQLDGLRGIAGDENVGGITAVRVRRAVAVHLREQRRKVYGSSG